MLYNVVLVSAVQQRESAVNVTVWVTTNWKILKEMGIPDHLTCLLRNLYAGQEATELDMEQQTGSK